MNLCNLWITFIQSQFADGNYCRTSQLGYKYLELQSEHPKEHKDNSLSSHIFTQMSSWSTPFCPGKITYALWTAVGNWLTWLNGNVHRTDDTSSDRLSLFTFRSIKSNFINDIKWNIRIFKNKNWIIVYPTFVTKRDSEDGEQRLGVTAARTTNHVWAYKHFGVLAASNSRSQWPRGLRQEPSSPARTLGSWIRIPLEAWMSVCIYSVCR
jgi:hypothetical protein